MRTVALIGDPVSHSVSPAMHRAAFRERGLDLDYLAIQVRSDELPAIFASLRDEHVGLNVTRPLKERVIDLLDEVSPDAARTRSVNTVTFADGRAVGDTTDGAGFLNALRRSGQPRSRRAVILGAGGVARAIGFALRGIGTHVTVSGRTRPRARSLAEELEGDDVPLDADPLRSALEQADLLVNATPVGGPGEEERSPLPDGVIPHAGLTVFETVYRPRITPLVRTAIEAGAHHVEGVHMLVEQGARSFEIWTGVHPPVEVMRAAAVAALEGAA